MTLPIRICPHCLTRMAITGLFCWKCGKTDLTSEQVVIRSYVQTYCIQSLHVPLAGSNGYWSEQDTEEYIQRMTEREEKYAEFFAAEAKVIENMTIEELQVHIESLESLRLEVSARLAKSNDSKKEHISRLSKSERDKLITTPDLSVSDSINAVNKRKDRMSAADKLRQTLKAMGLPDDEIDKQIMSTIKIDESKQAQSNKIVKSFNGKTQNEIREEAAKRLTTDAIPEQKEPPKSLDEIELF
jgi:hypothetical protein